MNEFVKNSIDARKNAFYNAYEIDDESVKNKIEELFKKIEDFGKQYNDVMDFETNFASNSLNQEYIDLFTLVASKCKPKAMDTIASENSDNEEEYHERSWAEYELDEASRPLRRNVREKVDSKIRDIPVVGDVIQAKQTMDLFNKFKKKDE